MKYKYLLFSVLIILSTQSLLSEKQGQEKLDSLLKVLPNAKKDTAQVRLLAKLSAGMQAVNPDKGIKYGERGVKLATELNWEQGIAENNASIGLNYALGKSDFTKGKLYFDKALKTYEELDLELELGKTLVNIGIVYQNQSSYNKAIENYEKALKIFERLKEKERIASTLGNIGFIYRSQSDYAKALEYYQRSLTLFENMGNKEGIATNLGNIGMIYDYQSDFTRALEYYSKAIKLKQELGDKTGEAAILSNIGLVYYFKNDYPHALQYLQKSVDIFDDIGNKYGVASILGNIGIIYQKQDEFSKALENYKEAVDIYEELGNKSSLASNLGNIGEFYYNISQDSVIVKIKEETNFISSDKKVNLERSISYYNQAIKLLEEVGERDTRSRFLMGLSDAYMLKGDYAKSLELYKDYIKLKDSVFTEKSQSQIANLEAIRENEIKDKEIEIKDLEISQSQNERYAVIGGAIAVGFIAIIIFRQRQRSEKLLLNILPVKIAKRLKKKERLIADDIECASIVFVDLVGFTNYSKDRKASDVLQMLNDVFDKFDGLILKYGLEKIKTIGDGYMAAAGVPEPCNDHAVRATNFSLDIHIVLKEINEKMNTDIHARVGIESGPIVAGVIGEMKFAYDLWGDSVNTASRMESTGTPGLVHISSNVKRELDAHSHNFWFDELEPMQVKGKGEMITYMVHRK
jgi:class 3 adenylate cyclase/Tfp pilus assembly protein PilF